MNGTAQKTATLGEMKDFVCAFAQSTPTDLPKEEMRYWASNKGELKNIIRDAMAKNKPCYLEWQLFYQKYFSMDLDLSKLQSPPEQEGFNRTIIIPKGITIEQAYEACSKNFPCWRWRENLNEAVSHNDRSPEKESYVIRVRDRQEADEENKNLSAEQVQKKNIKGITLLECLIFELKYWDETGSHLDVSNVTLCTGSRYSDGRVPRVDWDGSCLDVNWCNPQDADSCWRARTVVSF